MQTLEYQNIEKEIISSLNFKNNIHVEQHPDLDKQIQQATVLGNVYKSKVSIYFYDDVGLKRVQTTIWAAGNKYICLKGGVWIPISRIVEIKY
ncbi:MAG: hypothetical protein HYU67_02540 [Flavobacteriia bacterium]|nr:hypothetical protein [Flavobacteriia bacterium]